MKNHFGTVVAAIALSGTLIAAQASAPPSPSPSQAASQEQSPSIPSPTTQTEDQSLTGCLIQGSAPAIFLLENARATVEAASVMPSGSASSAAQGDRSTTSSGASRGLTYLVTASAASVDLKGQLNHQVTITGTGDTEVVSTPAQAPSPNARMNEKDLPKLAAKTVTKIADTCSRAG